MRILEATVIMAMTAVVIVIEMLTRLGIRMKRLRIMNRFSAACQFYSVICTKKLVPQGHNKDKIEPFKAPNQFSSMIYSKN